MTTSLSCVLVTLALVAGAAQTPPGQPPKPKGQMPDLGRPTKHDDTVPLFDFDAYFLGKWTFEWDMPEGPLGPAGRLEGTTVYTAGRRRSVPGGDRARPGPTGKLTIKEAITYQREQKTLTRDVTDSRGFTYTQTGTIGGDLGGIYTIYFESEPFKVSGQSVRLKHAMRLTSPLAYRVSTTVSVDNGAVPNYGTPWWRKAGRRAVQLRAETKSAGSVVGRKEVLCARDRSDDRSRGGGVVPSRDRGTG